MERYSLRHSGGMSSMEADFTAWNIKKELEKTLVNYQQVITEP